MTQEQVIGAWNLILRNIRLKYSHRNMVHVIVHTDGSGGIWADLPGKWNDEELERFNNLAELTDRYMEYKYPEEVKQ